LYFDNEAVLVLLRELSRSANYRYEGLEPLLATLAEQVIAPAEGR
jgi:hypothetical protein